MSRMAVMKVLCLLLLLTTVIEVSDEKRTSISRWIRLVGKSSNVVGFAFELSSFFGTGDAGGDNQLSSEELLQEISDLIKASEATILATLLETTKLNKIYDAVIAVHSSMKDLRLVVRTEEKDLAELHRQEFVTNYRGTEVIKHIRFLPELLTYIIPGLDAPLLAQLKEKTKCNREPMGNFRDFYVTLLTTGIALHATFEEFTKNVTLAYVLESEWDESLQKVQTDFDNMETECYDQLYNDAMSVCPVTDHNSFSNCVTGLSGGKVAGIVIGCLAALAISFFAGIFIYRRYQQKWFCCQ